MARRDISANPWLELLAECVAEIETTWAATPIPAAQALEWLYEYGAESRTSREGRINLSTVHGAKGREFRHVVILDGGDWNLDGRGEERRLYYVGMTRARETLTLCEAMRRPNPFTPDLQDGEYLVRSTAEEWPPPRVELNRRYKLLELSDVDLGFAGRLGAAHPVHRAICELRVGDQLQIVRTEDRWELRMPTGVTVGQLARECELPAGKFHNAAVSAILARNKRQSSSPEWASRCRVGEWEVVLCNIAASD